MSHISGKHRPQPLGRIEKLVIDNFKSYEGRHEIGPFDKFTCVIGPNGSGKSNIMDAISFCLGIKAKHLRGDRLKDLVYRREEESVESNSRRASATIHFRTAKGEELLFGRMIDSRGQGTYRYGPPTRVRNVGYDDFVKVLAKEHIYVKARNFLVFQGDVMELARRQGLDLTGVLETISGSDGLKDTYDRLFRELEVSQEKARMYFQHRREVEGGIALLEQQRAEVQRYLDLRKQKVQLGVELVLFRLFCIECEVRREQGEVQVFRSELGTVDGVLKRLRREADELEENRKQVEKEAEETASRHFVLSSNQEQLKPEIGNCRKQAAHWAKKLKEKKALIDADVEKHEGIKQMLLQVEKDRQEGEKQVRALHARDVEETLKLTADQRQQYELAVARTDALNVRTREQIRELDDQLSAATRDMEATRRDLADVEERRARAMPKAGALELEQRSLQAELESHAAQLQDGKQQLAHVEDEVRRFADFRNTLGEEHRSLRCSLDLARARRERLDHVEARQRLADDLRGAFPDGVIGRLSEMILPTQKRFDLPLQMCMGMMAEAFVVTDAAVGRDCVRYLKERRIGHETFLTLDRLDEPKVGPLHLLTQHKPARRLATLCVQHNEKFLERQARWQAQGPAIIDKAVNALLLGTIIVDDLAEAKATAYGDARSRNLLPRVVTLDGEVISPNGNMSVQSIAALGRVEFGGAEQLEEIRRQEAQLQQVEKDLETLREEFDRKAKREREMHERVRELENSFGECEDRLRSLKTGAREEERLAFNRERRLEELKRSFEQCSQRVQSLERQKEHLETELLQIGKRHFESLNKELGVEDVREIVHREQRERKRLRQEAEHADDLIRNLRSRERDLHQQMRVGSRIESLRRDCDQHERDIEAVSKRQEELEDRARVFEERCEKARILMVEAKAKKEVLDTDIKKNRLHLNESRSRVDDFRRKIRKQLDKLRVLFTYKFGILRESSERQLVVPLLSGGDGPLEQVMSQAQDLDDLTIGDLEKASVQVQPDFSALPLDRQELAQKTKIYDCKATEVEYEEKVADIDKELLTLNPNMRAIEQCEAETERLKEIRGQADEASLQSQRLSHEFEEVKSERLSRFMKCFKHVESVVHPFYRDLTSYDGNQGGSAYLDLDDAEEPYNGGITFTACPPGKRFFPMELLSGGEKSMASMALLFAMHSYQPPPFMILDEVDAPFDRKNTSSLVSYLRKLEFQCLVISLKDSCFSQSDALVGIYKDKELQSSGTVTLPLKRLGQALPEP